jgi:hypothetical protein
MFDPFCGKLVYLVKIAIARRVGVGGGCSSGRFFLSREVFQSLPRDERSEWRMGGFMKQLRI